MKSLKEKREIMKRAKSIRHTFNNRSKFSAIKYILKQIKLWENM